MDMLTCYYYQITYGLHMYQQFIRIIITLLFIIKRMVKMVFLLFKTASGSSQSLSYSKQHLF